MRGISEYDFVSSFLASPEVSTAAPYTNEWVRMSCWNELAHKSCQLISVSVVTSCAPICTVNNRDELRVAKGGS